MWRKLIVSCAIVALAACNPSGGAQRAPAHPSQSQATVVGEVRHGTITDENRTQVETNIRDMLGQASLQFAPGAAILPGMEDVVTAIDPGTDYQFPVSLESGGSYTFVGVCDVDCKNIDIELLKGDTGEVVGSDLLDDDFPVVQFTAPDSARYFVRLILHSCAQAPCYIGGRVLRAPAKPS